MEFKEFTKSLYFEEFMKIIWFIIIIYTLYIFSQKYNSTDKRIKYILLILFFTGFVYLIGKFLHTKDMYDKNKDVSNIYILSVVSTFVFLCFIFIFLRKMM